MLVNITHNKQKYIADLSNPLDISIPIHPDGINAWGIENLEINPVKSGEWIGDVKMGSPVNFNNIFFKYTRIEGASPISFKINTGTFILS